MTSPESGFMQASSAMGSIAAENAWLQEQISAGHLKMDSDAAEAGAKVYEDKAFKVEELARQANQLQQVSGLGDYASGVQLARKFGLKASNGQTGAADLLSQCADELRRKADLYRQAVKDYRATDDQISQGLQRGVQ
ncbi:hypothetical protein [Haloactinomyces albus]|uniref:Excreted virulence factor EspC, type VII ESX diderm n=1 Tax=Haloactinomyces albus TaxID=1352928 RepID=A0AAE3ZAX1_9ACTN|nr:hypothetical protein [Haloactinomyces albus]MDR7300570.1 hypothetical protein [Haloactinomyces albus]